MEDAGGLVIYHASAPLEWGSEEFNAYDHNKVASNLSKVGSSSSLLSNKLRHNRPYLSQAITSMTLTTIFRSKSFQARS